MRINAAFRVDIPERSWWSGSICHTSVHLSVSLFDIISFHALEILLMLQWLLEFLQANISSSMP
jgi:hypothetical protein